MSWVRRVLADKSANGTPPNVRKAFYSPSLYINSKKKKPLRLCVRNKKNRWIVTRSWRGLLNFNSPFWNDSCWFYKQFEMFKGLAFFRWKNANLMRVRIVFFKRYVWYQHINLSTPQLLNPKYWPQGNMTMCLAVISATPTTAYATPCAKQMRSSPLPHQ